MRTLIPLCLLSCLILLACTAKPSPEQITQEKAANKLAMTTLMQKHLDAVSNKDIKTLAATLAPDGQMQLILPSSEIKESSKAFIDFHEGWFKDTASAWTFETKILNTEVGRDLGMAITEIVYREPERDGKPYFNRMIVSYVLKKTDEQWYVIKDHASSVEKSTDPKE